MLAPDDRTLLVDLLAPPDEGFRLTRAVATTFTLDLEALVRLPLGFAGADLSSSVDPLGVLQALRNYRDRIDVFCQTGSVSVPSRGIDLLAFLEPMVHQVRAPRPGHLFHPKLWAARYTNNDGPDRFRFVCSSRNLTRDRAWDVAICLNGRVTPSRHAVNRPIADLLGSLADRVPAGLSAERRAAISDFAEAFRYVEWDRPEDVANGDWLAFHVLGRGRSNSTNLTGYRRLIVTPFLNTGGLSEVWPDHTGECVVVSRADEFDALEPQARSWLGSATLRVLDEAAAIPDIDSQEAGLRWSLSGLHAKLYVVERNKESHVFIGSANATDAAWRGNDEVMVEVTGRVARYGVQAALGSDDGAKAVDGFGRILIPYLQGKVAQEPPDAVLRRRLENALQELASITFTAVVEGEPEHPLLSVYSDEPLGVPANLPTDLELTFSLLTLASQVHHPVLGEPLRCRWQLSRVEEITPFLVVRLASDAGPNRVEVSSIVLARLVGDPADRLDRVLARRIGTPSEFLRFLLLLLQLAGHDDWFAEPGIGGSFGDFAGQGGDGLLESVLSALASAPRAIDDIDRLVRQLCSTEQGRKILPPGWSEFWSPVLTARSRLEAPQ